MMCVQNTNVLRDQNALSFKDWVLPRSIYKIFEVCIQFHIKIALICLTVVNIGSHEINFGSCSHLSSTKTYKTFEDVPFLIIRSFIKKSQVRRIFSSKEFVHIKPAPKQDCILLTKGVCDPISYLQCVLRSSQERIELLPATVSSYICHCQ